MEYERKYINFLKSLKITNTYLPYTYLFLDNPCETSTPTS